MKTFMMVDCETLAVNANAVVLSIGACVYNAEGIKDAIELFPSVSQQVEAGREISDDTLMWWFTRPDETRQSIVRGERQPLSVVADEFVDWAHQHRNQCGKENLWFSAFGIDFDLPLVTSLLGKYRTMPWEGGRPMYQNKMCLRAVNEIFADAIVWPEGPTKHTAMADAINQARAHINVLKKFPKLQ